MFNYYFKQNSNLLQIFFLLPLLILIIGCNKNRNIQTGAILTFKKELYTEILNTDISSKKVIIPLEFNEYSLIDNNSSIKKDGKDLFIYNRNKANPVLHFDMDGNFLNTIGSVGLGPNEFTEILDVIVDENNSTIEILSYNSIIFFSYSGKPFKTEKIDIPASSFTKENDYYWFYIGNDITYSKYRLFQTDDKFNIINNYLSDKSNMLPIMEYNFRQSPFNTFRESFFNNIYNINGDSLTMSYTVKFPGMEFPDYAHNLHPLEVVQYLKQQHYASIMCYLENDNYIYMQIMECETNASIKYYHWIINKNNNQEKIIRTGFIIDSYLSSPQLLTKDNKLYFLGYPIETEEEYIDPNTNPSLVIINLSQLFE